MRHSPTIKFYPLLTMILWILCLYFILGLAQAENTNIYFDTEVIHQMEKSHSGAAKRRFHSWKVLIDTNQQSSELNKLKVTNNFFNQFDYFSDTPLTGGEDHWDTPEEFIENQGGDCEDFALIKYFTLLSLGIPEEKLRMTYVKDLTTNQAHMVLAYYSQPQGDPLILDNIVSEILPAAKRTDLVPVYSFNGAGLWLAKSQKGEQRIGGSQGLDKWRNLIDRMKKGNSS